MPKKGQPVPPPRAALSIFGVRIPAAYLGLMSASASFSCAAIRIREHYLSLTSVISTTLAYMHALAYLRPVCGSPYRQPQGLSPFVASASFSLKGSYKLFLGVSLAPAAAKEKLV